MTTELHLPTGSFEIHDQVACYILCNLIAQILLNQRQRKIQPSRYTRSCPQISVMNLNGIRLHGDLGVFF
ncbi:hypothetical protein D9M70_539210 [compost metagenome]